MKYYKVLIAGILGFSGIVFLSGCGSAAISEAPPESPTLELPVATDPLHAGDMAPDFTLPDSTGNMVNLADALQDNEMVVLVFYFSHT